MSKQHSSSCHQLACSQVDSHRGSALCLALSASGLYAATLGSECILRLWDLRHTATAITQLDVSPPFVGVSHAVQSMSHSEVANYRQRLSMSPSEDQVALAAGLGGLAVSRLNLAEGSISVPVTVPVPATGSSGGVDTVEWHPKVDAVAFGCSHGAVGIHQFT